MASLRITFIVGLYVCLIIIQDLDARPKRWTKREATADVDSKPKRLHLRRERELDIEAKATRLEFRPKRDSDLGSKPKRLALDLDSKPKRLLFHARDSRGPAYRPKWMAILK